MDHTDILRRNIEGKTTVHECTVYTQLDDITVFDRETLQRNKSRTINK